MLADGLDKPWKVVLLDLAAMNSQLSERGLVRAHHLRWPREIKQTLPKIWHRALDHLLIDTTDEPRPVARHVCGIGQCYEKRMRIVTIVASRLDDVIASAATVLYQWGIALEPRGEGVELAGHPGGGRPLEMEACDA